MAAAFPRAAAAPNGISTCVTTWAWPPSTLRRWRWGAKKRIKVDSLDDEGAAWIDRGGAQRSTARRRLLMCAVGACCLVLLAWQLLWRRVVVSSYWRWLRNHSPVFGPVIYTPPIVYQADGFTPDWDAIFEPPILRRQTLHLRRDEVQIGLDGVNSVYKPTLTTGAELAVPVNTHFPGIVFPFECMFGYLPRSYAHKPLLARMIDVYEPSPYPVLTKARTPGDANAVLLPIDYHRYFNAEFLRLVHGDEGLDIPFREKASRVVWRGAPNDVGWQPDVPAPANTRRNLIERWFNDSSGRVDVGLSFVLGEALLPEFSEHWEQFVKPKLSAAEQLQNRYVLAVEGNDVATGLKWMLASRSVVLMPPPRREIWAQESLLKPWVHYLPVNMDFSDLLERMDWCEAHLAECEAISKRATQFVAGFNNTQKACRQGAKRLKEYLDKVTIVVHD